MEDDKDLASKNDHLISKDMDRIDINDSTQQSSRGSTVAAEPLTPLTAENKEGQPSVITEVRPPPPTKANDRPDPNANTISGSATNGNAKYPSIAIEGDPYEEDESKQSTTKDATNDELTVDHNFEVTPAINEEQAGTMAEDDEMGVGVGQKKKKKRKPKSKRGLNAPTGFEEYYVDAPLTPAEHEEEKQIYDQSYPFVQRIETAIQRFVARRKFDGASHTLFDRYLVRGGVKGGPKMFGGGLDRDTLEQKNAAEIAELTARNAVDADKVDAATSIHVVDFEACLKSFLSAQFPSQWELKDEDQVKKLVGILRNFFNYLLYHDVCPEYKDQIDAARAICNKAEKQLWNIAQVEPLLPGDFNKSCSEIFGGMYHGTWTANRTWMEGMGDDHQFGISPEKARKVFKIGVAANANEEIFENYKRQLKEKKTQITSVETTGLEVTEITIANREALELYHEPQSEGLKQLGKMRAKSWSRAYAQEDDLTEQEEAELAAHPPPIKYYEFWVEEEILSRFTVGMKLEVTVTQLSFGVSYFDAVYGVHPSFFTLIPNLLMEGWKEPETEWLPPRSRNGGGGGNVAEEGFDDDFAEDGDAPDVEGDKTVAEHPPDGLEDVQPTDTAANGQAEDVKKAGASDEKKSEHLPLSES